MQTFKSDKILAKKLEEVRLDLFKLHDENDKGIGRIRAVLTPDLKITLKNILKEIQTNGVKAEEISKYVGLSHSTELYSYVDRWNIPLVILNKLIGFWSKNTGRNVESKRLEIIDLIKKLSCGAGINYTEIKCPKILTKNLSKLCGAIVSDGNLNFGKTNSGDQANRVTLRDGYEDSVNLFCDWAMSEFDIKLKPKISKSRKYWTVAFTNKIIFRYFNKLFEIPYGKKSRIVKLPELIKNSDLNYQIEFFKSISMFDGCICSMSGYFEFNCMSKQLVENFTTVLEKCDIVPDYTKFNEGGRSFLKIRQKEKLEKVLLLFIEPNTIKWEQLNSHINGFYNFESLEEALAVLDRLYPKKRNGTISFTDVVKSVNDGNATLKELIKLRKHKSTLYRFLEKLEWWKIIQSQKISLGHGWFYKAWRINPNLKQNGKEMTKITEKRDMIGRVKEVMTDPTRIRNVATSSHVHHGKTTLTDNLMGGAGMLSEKVVGDVETGMFTWFDERSQRPVNKNVNASSPYTAQNNA